MIFWEDGEARLCHCWQPAPGFIWANVVYLRVSFAATKPSASSTARCKFQTRVCNGQGLSAHARHVGGDCSHHNTHRIPCYCPLLQSVTSQHLSTRAVRAMRGWLAPLEIHHRSNNNNNKWRDTCFAHQIDITWRIMKGIRVNTSSHYTCRPHWKYSSVRRPSRHAIEDDMT